MPKDKVVDLKVEAEWVEASREGSFNCPLCGCLMIVTPWLYSPIGFCLKCQKYFIDKGTKEVNNAKR